MFSRLCQGQIERLQSAAAAEEEAVAVALLVAIKVVTVEVVVTVVVVMVVAFASQPRQYVIVYSVLSASVSAVSKRFLCAAKCSRILHPSFLFLFLFFCSLSFATAWVMQLRRW